MSLKFDFLLDWLYPPICEICDGKLSQGRSLCDNCVETLPKIEFPFCQSCGEFFLGQIEDEFACPNCRGISYHFQFARAALACSEKTTELIHRFKYGREIHLGYELGRITCQAFSDARLARALEEKWTLVPVPLFRSKKFERHFNQSEEIARSIAKETGLSISHSLKRIRNTSTQTLLSRKQRMENLRDAFALRVSSIKILDYPGILIVDDVFTTGSTVNECAKVLKKAGAKQIAVLTVMRG